MDAASWNPQDPALAPGHDDEFQQFLNMGGMGNMSDSMTFDFNDYQAGNGSSIMQSGRDQLDTQMGGTDANMVMGDANSAMQQHLINMTTATAHPAIPTQMIPPPTPTDAITEIDAQIQYLQQQRMQQQHRQIHEQHVYYANQSHAVPPTPQSLEMPPASNQFYPDQRQTPMFDSRYQRMKEQQDMAFTPLVSPAVTPLDPHFQMEAGGFGVPSTYFSPLTSPALHAQSDQGGLLYDRRSSLSAHNSPAEMEVETNTANVQPVLDLAKKARKTNAFRAKAKANVRQSPISKPQRKKAGPTPKMVSQALTEMQEVNEDGLDQMLPSTALPGPMSSEESENASVSPENLSDMPPPPIPQKQSSKSPFIQPQPQPQPHPAIPAHIQGKPSPATPASLMKLPASSANNSTSSNPQDLGPSEHIESFELPESVNFNPRPQPPRIDTATPTQSPSDPGSARAASFQPLPSPVFAKPTAAASASASPNLAPGSTGPSARKTPLLMARGSKSKRGSVSSVHVSPALRPRISPSIKPLLPGTPGMSAEDTASRLLASKSNYQNILEGNTVPGVHYPSELSTNLTSKRTSHKIAEQGRRNRINSALQEIATLLPQPVKDSKNSGESDSADKKDKDKDKSGATPNSKASTVELAIEYIKQLQQEVAEANKRAEEAEKKLELKEKSAVQEPAEQKERTMG
ncbi:helix-loop-helix DNA-binding domain-containing protein [Colletotrichum karsti]|uniref:Helix-loop-helix DNA-binding domain-containing protein n=1 Tax=Colletotrichum karsti TaxID=1095194 RepID=A0A9P6LK71_9PEZI|nr:helix-loop-helix DNA-binding domain-containing protein [Colletotrichum karsti]KAF9879059.1 helix-loop-helix DNA-binding domain-containing protein [Colletotrichum karsti]